MDILAIAKEQLNFMGNPSAIILEISRVGSSVFKEHLEDAHDLDYLILCSNFSRKRNFVKPVIDGIRYDLMFYELSEYISEHEFSAYSIMADRHSVYSNVWAVIRLKEHGDSGYSWDLFSHAQEYKEYMAMYLFNCGFNPVKITRSLRGKQFVVAYIALKFLEKNSTTIDDEMLRIIRRLYSCTGRDEECEQIVRWIGQQLGLTYQIQ